MWINALVSIWNENSNSENVFDDCKRSFKLRNQPIFKTLTPDAEKKYQKFCMTSNEVKNMNVVTIILNIIFALISFLFIRQFSLKYLILVGLAYIIFDILMTIINTVVKIYFPKMKLKNLNAEKISSLIIKFSNEEVSLKESIQKSKSECDNCFYQGSRCDRCFKKEKEDLKVISNRISYLKLLNSYIGTLVKETKVIEKPINPADINNITKVNMFIKRLNSKTENYPMVKETITLLNSFLNKLQEKENGADLVPNRLLIHLNEITDILDKLDSYSENSSEAQLKMLKDVVAELNIYISGLINKTIDEKKTDVNISLKVMYDLLKSDNGPSDWNGGN